jgi:hypothetical protein
MRIFYLSDDGTEGLLYLCQQGNINLASPWAAIDLTDLGVVTPINGGWGEQEKAQVVPELLINRHICGAIACSVPDPYLSQAL